MGLTIFLYLDTVNLVCEDQEDTRVSRVWFDRQNSRGRIAPVELEPSPK